MKMVPLLLAVLAALSSQAEPAADPAGVVGYAMAEPCSLAAGSSDSLALVFEITEGFHIQANPASDEFLVPAELRIEGIEGLHTAVLRYPAPELHALEGSDMLLKTYSGSFSIPIVVRAGEELGPGEYSLVGELAYQACDARRCLSPRRTPFSLKVVVGGS